MVTSVRLQPPVIMTGMQNEIRTQATNLAANISGVRESATTTLSGEIKGTQLEDFPALTKQASLEALFKCGKDADALKEIFTHSSNISAKRAVTEFSELFNSALKNTSGSSEATALLMQLGEEYTAHIMKDGLQNKSAFGPWTPDTKKAEAKLQKLNERLLDIVNNNTGGNLGALTTNFVVRDVMPYIANCIEHNFNCELDPSTRSGIMQLVDRAAAKAVEALDACHQKLIDEQGPSVGLQARHLETAALIPLLLRNVFAQIPADKLPETKTPEPAAGPVPDGGKKPEAAGINININIDSSNHSVDNSKHINNSRSHIDNSQRHIDKSNHDNSRKTIDNSRTFIDNSQRHTSTSNTVNNSYSRVDSNAHQTETAHSASKGIFDQGITGKIDVTAHATAEATTNASSESTDGKVVTTEKGTNGETVAFDEVDGVISKGIIGEPVQATVHGVGDNKEQSQTADIVDVKPLSSQLASVENNKVQLQESETTVITGNKTETAVDTTIHPDKSSPFEGLKFKQNGIVSSLPSIMNMRSMHFNAREEFLGIVRKALEPDISTPISARREFDKVRNQILPNNVDSRASSKAPEGDMKNGLSIIAEQLSSHPQKEKLAEVAKSFARESGLTKNKGETDQVLSMVLDSILGEPGWREGPAFESYLNKPGSDRVTLTVDGLHMSR